MVTFRFHLVSLIAVFLALGLGILVGSSVVDRVIVNRLDNEIRSVRRESSQANTQLGLATDKLSKGDDFLHKLAPYAVSQRLTGVPVVIVAERGVDPAVVKSTIATVRSAGADVPGVLWLTDSWRLDAPKDLDALQSAVKVSGNNAGSRTAALKLLARRVAEPQSTAARTTDVIDSLRSAGFVDITDGDRTAVAAFPKRAARVLYVTGTDGHLRGTDTTNTWVQALTSANVPTVVAEVYDDHRGELPVPQRGESVAPIRGDAALAKAVSTLDDLETTQGQITSVLALEQIVGAPAGHYGYGQGASAVMPAYGS